MDHYEREDAHFGSADYPPCGECRHFLPTGMMGFVARGRILRRDEGRCTTCGSVVSSRDLRECELFEGRP